MDYEIFKVLGSTYPMINEGDYLHMPYSMAFRAEYIALTNNNIMPKCGEQILWSDIFLVGNYMNEFLEEFKFYVGGAHYYEEKLEEHVFGLSISDVWDQDGGIHLRIDKQLTPHLYGEIDRQRWLFFNQSEKVKKSVYLPPESESREEDEVEF